MADKWAVDLVEALQKKKGSATSNEGISGRNSYEIMIGRVVSADPLFIEINGQVIKKYLYLNPALTLLASNDSNKISDAFADALKIKGGVDGITRTPKSSSQTSGVDQFIDVAYTGNPIIDVGWFDFLKEFHQRFVIKKGDTVIVLQVGVSFYILAKAVET